MIIRIMIGIIRITILYNQDDHYRESSGCFPKILRIIMILIKMIHMMIMIKISNRNLRFGEKKGENQESFPIVSNLQRETAKICSKICTGVPRMRKILTFRIIGKNDKGGPYKENYQDPTLNLQGCPK